MKKIYVIGHKNPDTDSISSTLAYARLKQRLGINAIPARIGTLNEETKFVTRYFNVEAPNMISDARSRLSDIELDKAVEISEDASCNDAYKLIAEGSSSLAVTEDHILRGVISTSNLIKTRLMSPTERHKLIAKTNVKTVADDVEGEILSYPEGFMNNGHISVFSTHYREKGDLYKGSILITDNKSLLLDALNEGAAMVVYSGDSIYQEIVDSYKNRNVALIKTRLDVEDIIRLVYEAIPVKYLMSKKPVTFKSDEYIEEVAKKVMSTRYRMYPVLDEEGRVLGNVTRYHLLNYEKMKFILVDHSSKAQTINNIDSAEIIEVVDHHHIGDITTTVPINYRNQTCGATSTIIYQMYKENGLVPEKEYAGLMLSAIISDTLKFVSKTCTELDVRSAEELAEIAGVNIDEYADLLLSASVNLENADIKELIERDLKKYELSSMKIAVGQTNYDRISDVQKRLDEFKKSLSKYQEDKGLDLLVMMFTSVKAEGTMFLFFGEKRDAVSSLLETVFDDNSGYDSRIISRKQQLIPKLSKVLEQY